MKSSIKHLQLFTVVNLLFFSPVLAQFAGGTGTVADPWQIETAAQLDSVRHHLDGNFILTDDINLNFYPYNSGEGWEPIGDYDNRFTGTFNGNRRVISNLYINRGNTTSYSGLFGAVGTKTSGGTAITNLGLEDVDITGGYYVAAVAGFMEFANLTASYSTGEINGRSTIGGLVGIAIFSSIISESYSTSDVTASGPYYTIGGIVGRLFDSAELENSYSSGSVIGFGQVGGAVGQMDYYAEINDSYSIANVSGTEDTGALVGLISDVGVLATNSFWNSESSGIDSSALGTELTLSEMMMEAEYTDWDFDEVWDIEEGTGFPSLQWEADTAASPRNLSAESGNEEIDLMWNSPLNASPDGFRIYRNSVLVNSGALVTDTTYNDTDVENFSEYAYTVIAVYNEGPYERESGPTSEVNVVPLPDFEGGTGSAANPWQVSNADQLNMIRFFLDSSFVLIGDINLNTTPYNSGEGWEPIGTLSEPFTGSMNGNFYEVHGLYINRSEDSNIGLFGYSNGDIDSLGVLADTVKGLDNVGVLAGLVSEGTVTHSYSEGIIGASRIAVGGLIGSVRDNGVVSQSYSTVDIISSNNAIGGLIGTLTENGLVENSYATGDVFAERSSGGLIGQLVNSEGVLNNSYSLGKVISEEGQGSGLTDYNFGTINNSYWNTETSFQSESEGGTGLTTEQLTHQTSFSGWDFSSVWGIDEGTGYPYLLWQGGTEPHNIPEYSAPRNLTYSDLEEQISLIWNKPIFHEPEGYRVYRDSVLLNNLSLITDTVYTDNSIVIGTNYTYFIIAVYDSSGSEVTSEGSDELQAAAYSSLAGSGTLADPWQISEPQDLLAMNAKPDSNFILTNDIDLTYATSDPDGIFYHGGQGWEPIGSSGSSFTGTLNGKGHVVRGVISNRSTEEAEDVLGFFGVLSGSVDSLAFEDIVLQGTGFVYTGIIAGVNTGQITNSYVEGSIKGENQFVGGITGINGGTISNVYSSTNITGLYSGGIVAGTFGGSIENVFASGIFTGFVAGGIYAGDLGGGTVSNAFWNTTISEIMTSPVGTGLTTSEMLDSTNFSGLDFENTWDIYEGHGFPFLRDVGTHRTNVLEITGSEGWRILSSPVDSISYDSLLKDLWTQGFTGADHEGGTSNIYTWDEATKQFQSISSASDIPPAGQGFLVYVYDDVDYDETPDGFPKTMMIKGDMLSGGATPTLSYTDTDDEGNDGWNLVGNPYAFPLSWAAGSGWTKTNLDDSFYVWNAEDSSYQSHNGSVGTLPDSLIAPGQGFWVKANAAEPSLNMTWDTRSSGGELLKKKPITKISFTLKSESRSSNTIVTFNDSAEFGKDSKDAFKLRSLKSEYISLFTLLEDNTGLDINALPSELEESINIPLDLELSTLGGIHELPLRLGWSINAFPENWTLTLIDNKTGQQIDLRDESSYEFEEMAGTQSKTIAQARNTKVETQDLASIDSSIEKGFKSVSELSPKVLKVSKSGKNKTTAEAKARFTLTIIPGTSIPNELETGLPTQTDLSQNYPNPFNPSTVIRYQLSVNSRVVLKVYDMLGREVATLIDGSMEAGYHQVTLNARGLASGMYLYRLQAGDKVFTKKLTLIK